MIFVWLMVTYQGWGNIRAGGAEINTSQYKMIFDGLSEIADPELFRTNPGSEPGSEPRYNGR